MKRTALATLALLCLFVNFMPAQSEADDAYIKAMTANNPAQKAQLLKDYIAKYAGKGSKYDNFAYANLCLMQFPGKTPKETTDYGEKALAAGGLDDNTKIQVLLTVSAILGQSGQGLDKAKSFAGQVIELAKANKNKEGEQQNAALWNRMIGAGYFTLGAAAEKAGDVGGAADAYINSYAILKDPKIITQIKKLAKTLYDAKKFAEAEKVFRTLYNQSKDPESALILGQTLYKNNKADEALALFKEAYAKKKTGELAYNIGIIMAQRAKSSPAEASQAIDYLLEASYLYPAQSSQALGMAQSLFFSTSSDAKYNEVIKQIQEKNKKIDELTKTFNTKFEGKNEEDLTEDEKAEMNKILADIDAQKQEIKKLQSSSSDMTAKWTKRMEDIKKKLGL
jgi:hypothetical protein